MKLLLATIILITVATVTVPAQAATERPKIRVGLFETTEPITVTADGKSKMRSNGSVLGILTTGTEATIAYDSATALYTVTTADWSTTSSTAIQIDPNKRNKIVTISSYSNPPAWDASLNDNQFYGSVELNDGWVVNELGIENYVKGIAEASNDNPQAYLKALYTAARTYVYFQYLYPTKHAGEPYLVDATANDQVYRGYGMTSRSPNVVSAVEATSGQIVTYEDAVVVTPYFSQSDGRTRAWSEVWSGDYTYLQSVDDPGCTGDELLGHGVGMSAKGARYFANQEYWHWREILQYYYQGVEIKQLW